MISLHFTSPRQPAARRALVLAGLLLLLLCLPAIRVAAQPEPGESPNILLIYADDHAVNAVGAYGSQINDTPQLDRLAAEGMLFRNSFVINSICTPARATVLTGKYSHANGTLVIGDWFDGSQPTFPKMLRAAGYQTAVVGKWHLFSEPTGFDHHDVLIDQGPYYNPPMIENGKRVQRTGYTTDLITDQALKWLKTQRNPDQPFMLMLQHKAPHRPWAPGPDHLQTYEDQTIAEPDTLFDDYTGRTDAAREASMTIAQHLHPHDLKLVPLGNLNPQQLQPWDAAYGPRNRELEQTDPTGDDRTRWNYQRYIKDYLRSVASIDDNLGRVLDYLDESGLAENTVVIYTSDQGFFLGEHGWFDKRFMYEESLRTPLIVRWPGVVEPGSENHDMVLNLDLPETFLQIAGLEVPQAMQGRSLTPLLRSESPEDWRTSLYYHYYDYPAIHTVHKHLGVRTQRYKLIHFYELDQWELFDLQEDPREMRSVYDDPDYAEVVAQLEQELKRLQAEFGDDQPMQSPAEVRQAYVQRHAEAVESRAVVQLESPGGEVPTPDAAGKPLTVGLWCVPDTADQTAVLVSQGGDLAGYSLWLDEGRPTFTVRDQRQAYEAQSDEPLSARQAAHVMGRLSADGRMTLLVDGQVVATAEGRLMTRTPFEGFTVGGDPQTRVGRYPAGAGFSGRLRDIRLYWSAPDDTAMGSWLSRRPQ